MAKRRNSTWSIIYKRVDRGERLIEVHISRRPIDLSDLHSSPSPIPLQKNNRKGRPGRSIAIFYTPKNIVHDNNNNNLS